MKETVAIFIVGIGFQSLQVLFEHRQCALLKILSLFP